MMLYLELIERLPDKVFIYEAIYYKFDAYLMAYYETS